MLNCLLDSCQKELFAESAVSLIADKKFENYSGLYCSFEHGLADALNTIIKPDNLPAFFSNHFSGISATSPALLTSDGAGIAATEAAQPASPASDNELSLLADAASSPDEVTALNNNEDIINSVTHKVKRFNEVITEWIAYSQDTDFVLDAQVISSTTVFDIPGGSHEVNSPSVYGIFSMNPAFSFNIYFTPQSINLMFANSSDNLSISGLDSFYSEDSSVYISAVDEFIKTVHNNIRTMAFNSVSTTDAQVDVPEATEEF